jgi:hypothetical protein
MSDPDECKKCPSKDTCKQSSDNNLYSASLQIHRETGNTQLIIALGDQVILTIPKSMFDDSDMAGVKDGVNYLLSQFVPLHKKVVDYERREQNAKDLAGKLGLGYLYKDDLGEVSETKVLDHSLIPKGSKPN